MILIRKPEEIYQASGPIENGTFTGRWHFSIDDYFDAKYMQFGTLKTLNDETLSPGAGWPLHPHHGPEIVIYCAAGEFRYVDERGKGSVLKAGWVQHTSVGTGIWHAEVNNSADAPARLIRMWFQPSKRRLKPSVELKQVDKSERTNNFLSLVSPRGGALVIHSDAEVLSCFLEKGRSVERAIAPGRGLYLCVLDGGPVTVNGHRLAAPGAAEITDEAELSTRAESDAELLLVDVPL